MANEQLYRDRAKEARKKAAAATDETTRQLLLEVAKGFERLADLVEKTPERVRAKDLGALLPQSGHRVTAGLARLRWARPIRRM
jgi:hypothetical protein